MGHKILRNTAVAAGVIAFAIVVDAIVFLSVIEILDGTGEIF